MSSLGLCAYKDEVTELVVQLNTAENQRNSMKYKQLIQQVILYMTKGIDMTPLFMTIVKAAASKDLVQKKLCYLYLCHYASSNADLALLTVNTLKRDAEDTNYMVRGLALRSIGSLRLPDLVEYTKDVMVKGLKDHSSYVRKAAVIGCLQLSLLAPKELPDHQLISPFNERLTKDKDIQVSRNAMYALEEMSIEEKTASKLHRFILKRLPRFGEWGLQFCLNVLMRCRPEKEEDIYNSLNCLDICLKHANTSVVLGAVTLFLSYTSGLHGLKDDVFNRIKVPLLTALSSKSPEISYSVLCHIEVIIHGAPFVFEDSISSFYCRYNDPVYLKVKKLNVLSKLVTETNGKKILDELSYYARHDETASDSIHNIGMMALLHPTFADICIEKLFSFLQLRNDSVVSHTLAALRELVIKYDKYSELIPNISKYLKRDLLQDGRTSVVWMLGEFGESISEAPYVLEVLIDDIDKETSAVVKLELLTASMKLFFKRPPECQAMLGHLLEYCIEQEYNMEIRDRALLYYRLLEIDVNKAKEVICCPRRAQFIDSTNVVKIDSKELLFREFNTLSVVYGETWSAFSREDQPRKVVKDAKDASRNKPFLPLDDSIDLEDNIVDLKEKNEPKRNDGLVEDVGNVDPMSGCLIEVDDSSTFLREERISSDENTSGRDGEVSVEDDASPSSSLELVEEPDLSPEVFETLWRQLPETESYELQLDEIPDQTNFLRLLTNQRIYTMASTPPDAEQIRCFLYAQSNCYILCEVSLDTTTLNLKCVIKMEDPGNVHSFIEVFQNCLVAE